MVVGIRVGTNAITLFRPVLFYSAVTKKPCFISELSLSIYTYACGCGPVTAPCRSVSASLLVIV